jgi:hypothetical protein
MAVAGNNAAAIDACKLTATDYAKLTNQSQTEASCKSAKATAIASGQCTNSFDSPDSGTTVATVTSTCARYLSCVFAASPTLAAGASASYGEQGACWATQTREVCTSGCRLGLESLHRAHSTIRACDLCVGDSDCSGSTPVCDLAQGDCVGVGGGSCSASSADLSYCVQYSGSSYSADSVKTACSQGGNTYSSGACAPGTGKSCVFMKGTSTEYRYVFYSASSSLSPETLCATAGGTYE